MAFQVERYDASDPPAPLWDKRNRRYVKRVAWCAESLPEASQAVAASSKFSGKAPTAIEAAAEDAYATTLTQTFTRTEIAEIYRQMAFQACQAWAQGIYTDLQYSQRLDNMLTSGMKVIEERASQPLTPTPKPTPTPTPSPTPAKP